MSVTTQPQCITNRSLSLLKSQNVHISQICNISNASIEEASPQQVVNSMHKLRKCEPSMLLCLQFSVTKYDPTDALAKMMEGSNGGCVKVPHVYFHMYTHSEMKL